MKSQLPGRARWWMRLALWACAVSVAAGAATAAPPVARKEAGEAHDIEAWLRACPGFGFRSAKLYATRVLGIELMKRSADLNQARSALDFERLLDPTLAQLRRRGVPDAEVQQIEDALTILVEVTAQNALASDVVTTQRSAERLGAACTRSATRLGLASSRSAPASVTEHLNAVRALSQQLAMDYLVSAVSAKKPAPASAALLGELELRLADIRKAGAASRALQNASALLDMQWLFMRHALLPDRPAGSQQFEHVAHTSEIIFDIVDAELAAIRRQRAN